MGKPLITAVARGPREVSETLGRFKKAIRNRMMRRAMAKGIRPLAWKIKEKAPQQTRTLYRSIGTKAVTYRQSGIHVAMAGPRMGFGREVDVKVRNAKGRTVRTFKQYRDPVRYGPIVEKRQPFMLPAFVEGKGEAENLVVASLRADIEEFK